MVTKDDALSQLDARGFLLIRSFLNSEQIEMLSRDFDAASLEENSNYSLRRISRDALSWLAEPCQKLIDQLESESEVRVNLVSDGIYFTTFSEKPTLVRLLPGPQKFPWHQDHENYWLWQDSKNYLNFYIPIVKPSVEKSNLTLAPFDQIFQRAPEIHRRLIGRGATRVVKSGRKWVVKDDDRSGKVGQLEFDLAEIEETPSLQAGDLLLMRGDLLHRTQDASTRRIAASIRYINRETLIRRSDLATGGLVKALMMLNSRDLYGPAIECFKAYEAETLPAAVVDRFLKDHQGTKPGRAAFLARLLREKMRGRPTLRAMRAKQV